MKGDVISRNHLAGIAVNKWVLTPMWATSYSCILVHWWCPIWSFMSSHLSALQLAPCPPLIQSQCCLCISYDCALWSGASPCSPEQTRCRPEDSTVIQAISVLKSVVVWASSLAGFMWSSGPCLKSDTLILFFLITNKQLESCLLVVFWLVDLLACFVKP